MARHPSLLLVPLLLVACRSSEPSTSRYPEPIPTAESGPVLFSPGYVSSGLAERDAAFSVDGSIFAFTQLEGTEGTIALLQAGVPQIAPFSGEFNDLEPFFDPRGGWLWFASDRPHPEDETRRDWNIWRVAIEGDGWGDPEIVRGLDGAGDEFYPTVALDGTVAFTAERDGGAGGEDIWLAVPDPEGGWIVENAGSGVNTAGPEFNALITPDGRMLVFSSVRAHDPRDQGGGDLYVSTRRWDDPIPREASATTEADEAGADPALAEYFVVEAGFGADWSAAVPLEPYNSPALDFCPAVTPDGRYLVFTSRRTVTPPSTAGETFPRMRARLTGPGNGQSDLWWAPMPGAR